MNVFHNTKKLPREFYSRDVLLVAKDLLGKIFVHVCDDELLAGKIVEVEAYHGKNDEAAHSFKGKTKRTEVMFGKGGHLYLYFIYGSNFCSNVVAGKKEEGCAVLLRAIEPLAGIEKMYSNRFGKTNRKKIVDLTNGPGKITQAFCINNLHNGMDLTGGEMYILDSEKVNAKEIVVSKRIGISKSKDLPWRFFIKNNPCVSKK